MKWLLAYPTMLRVGLAETIAYRAEMLVWMLTTTMPLVSLALWSAVARDAPVGPYGEKEFVRYFLVTLLVRQLTGCWLVWELNHEIRTGILSQRLLRPVHPFVAYSAENLGALPIRALISSPIAIIAFYVGGQHLFSGRPILILPWILSLIGAWLINFFVMALVGSLAFYLESALGVFDAYFGLFMVFSGYLIPLSLFPNWLTNLNNWLPFRYTIGFPVELASGMLNPDRIGPELAIQWSWAAICCILSLLLFRRGINRYSAFGG